MVRKKFATEDYLAGLYGLACARLMYFKFSIQDAMVKDKHEKIKKECCQKYRKKGKCCKECPYHDQCPILVEKYYQKKK